VRTAATPLGVDGWAAAALGTVDLDADRLCAFVRWVEG
jgi:hypothetical protein